MEPVDLDMGNSLHYRRHSQSYQSPISTKLRYRKRSHSITSHHHLAAQLASKIKMIEHADKTGFLRYMDDQVHEKWDAAKAAMVGAQRLLQFHELPSEWQENEYVLSGYRFYQNSRDCLRSIFMLHNETMNIWSHLLGFIFMAGLSAYGFNRHFPEASFNDRMVFMAFCVAALKCLFCSSIYHTFICHSHFTVKAFTATLDYIGIAILITASILVTEYYGFYCRPTPQFRYMIFTTVVGSVGIISPFFKCWDTKQYRPLRVAVFLLIAFSSIVPVMHLIRLNGLASTMEFFELAGVSVMMYLFGVIIYVNRFPERLFPGKFDFAGLTSHAIWHVFVCLGIYFHYLASLNFYSQRLSYGCRL
ncbi:hemolysin-III related-domain-containing protein [Radiomyces spectabilis]|uniref:hemolysin-III related-domain-containing protein n=1 Tax=Radiomyces spectabilis TaxID=64574 RepID=UPI00221F1630|nr:hemolysin-III related-domain-containing protein [Radiomyces spectabilis]KAI8374494.1 hemolysin-III related-domain-containing protein [Radiomyces spectabilis]